MNLAKHLLFVGISFASLQVFANSNIILSDHTYDVRDIIVINQPEVEKENKEALLILPGFGDTQKRRKKQKKFFKNLNYDLYIPDYRHRKSFEETVNKLDQFYTKHELEKYEKAVPHTK